MKCKICNKELKNIKSLSSHIFIHNIKLKSYYDKYFIKNDNEKKCLICGEEKIFLSLIKGYKLTCGKPLCLKIIQRKRKKELYDDENYNNRKKANETRIKNSGTLENSYKKGSEKNIKNKLNNVDENGLNSIQRGVIKNKETKLKNHGDPNYCNVKKIKQTKLNNIDKNGMNSFERQSIKIKETFENKSEEEWNRIRKQSKQTNIQLYGVEFYMNRESTEKTCLEKYGGISPLSSKIIHEKGMKKKLENKSYACFYSKISQELFWKIYELLPNELKQYTYFAELNNEFGKFDNEYKKYYFYDFIISNKKICIEFNGDYFHANPKLYKENDKPNPHNKNLTSKDIWDKDKIKNDFIKNCGYALFIVWESDYINDKELQIKNLIENIIKV
jgi:hypothetical protein